MTLNILFFSITFKRKQMTVEEFNHQEQIERIREEYRLRSSAQELL
ncbi:YrzI family small protein [Peribacillus saganii]|uniref:YrzI family small protein n=1 Tax=Peribacillus saganii TaxID=2303992 RepID=A0A372LTW4_9BACI|nr:YrzI family small protein [Peribacillus saganii]RFU71641.1 YrzI family small protein [Peribacillus saganii]